MSRMNSERRYTLAVALVGPGANQMRITQYCELLEGGHVEEYRVRHLTRYRPELRSHVEDYLYDCGQMEQARQKRCAKKVPLTAKDWAEIDRQDSLQGM